MENEIQINGNKSGVANSESVANGGVANSIDCDLNELIEISKHNITDENLVELGFPNILLKINGDEYRYGGKANAKQDYKIQCDFYNALYVFRMLSEKYNNKTFNIKHTNNTIFLNNNNDVFYLQTTKSYVYLWVDTRHILFLLLELLKKTDFEALKQEFAKLYAEEKSKIELNEIVIHEKQKFIEALKSNKDFAKKQISYYLRFAMHFGENYVLDKANLKQNLSYLFNKRKIFSIRIYKNLLIISTARKNYVIELNEAEKQKLNEIITSLNL